MIQMKMSNEQYVNLIGIDLIKVWQCINAFSCGMDSAIKLQATIRVDTVLENRRARLCR